jgi:acyl carrier protein
MSGAVSVADRRARVLELLASVAPDVDVNAVRADVEFREQFDFDSMDVFNFAAALHEAFGIDIPERDYRQLLRLDRCLAYLDAHPGDAGQARRPGAA